MIIGIIGQGVTDLFADILYSGEEDNVLGDDETEEESGVTAIPEESTPKKQGGN